MSFRPPLLLVAAVALSTLLQVAVAPRSLVGYLTAGATPVWLLGSFAVLSLLYRAGATSGAQAPAGIERADRGAGLPAPGADQALSGAEAEQSSEPALTKRVLAERAYAALSAEGAPVSGAQLATAAGLSASYARALAAEFSARAPAAAQRNGELSSRPARGAGR